MILQLLALEEEWYTYSVLVAVAEGPLVADTTELAQAGCKNHTPNDIPEHDDVHMYVTIDGADITNRPSYHPGHLSSHACLRS